MRYRDVSIENVTISRAYLHSAFIVQSNSSAGDVWIAESGASCHMTHNNNSNMLDISPPPPGREAIMFGDKRRLRDGRRENKTDIFISFSHIHDEDLSQ